MIPGLRTYSVSEKARRPLVDFITGSLVASGCRIMHHSSPDSAPFIVSFETPTGERIGIVAYAFLATRTPTKNRPSDERSFQLKYGSKQSYSDENSHDLWQDPLGMFTTMLLGIDPTEGFCVSADPVIHSPTKFFIRMEFKDHHADEVMGRGWHVWQRVKRREVQSGPLVETLAGCTAERFLDLVRYERACRGLDPGNRLILGEGYILELPKERAVPTAAELVEAPQPHPLAQQFNLSSDEIMDLIAGARRLKMAVRGWVAEEHLRATLSGFPGVTSCERLDDEGGPDLRVSYRDGPPLMIECKNVARQLDRNGNAKIDFQRTRASKGDPCSRYYQTTDFDIVAACLHAVAGDWSFEYVLPRDLVSHKSCVGRIGNNVRVDEAWTADIDKIFRLAYAEKGVTLSGG